MNDANVKLVQRGFDAFAQGDMAAMAEVLSPDVKWHSSGNNVISGDYEGLEATLGLFAKIGQETGGQVANEIHAILADDEHAVALVSATTTRNDKTASGGQVFVFHIGGGQLTECWVTSDNQEVFDDLWS